MPDYVFRCEETYERMTIEMSMDEVPPIGAYVICICDEPDVHNMRRMVQNVRMAAIPGTPTNRIGMALEDRAELARRRRREMDKQQKEIMRHGRQ